MRIRTIKPEFWISESVGRLSREARLLFIGLWSFADDSGRGRGALPAISGTLFPYDTDALENMPKWFAELEAENMVRRYVGDDGNTYYDLPKWSKHQKIEKPTASRIPPFTDNSPNPPRILPESSPPGSGIRDQGSRDQGSRDQEIPPSGGPRPKRKTALPSDWQPNEAHANLSRSLGVDMRRQEEAFRDYEAANRRLMVDWDATFRNWLRKSAEYRSRGAVGRKLTTQEQSQIAIQEWLKEAEEAEEDERNEQQRNSGSVAVDSGIISGSLAADKTNRASVVQDAFGHRPEIRSRGGN